MAIDERRKAIIHVEDILNIAHRYTAIETQSCILHISQPRYALFIKYSKLMRETESEIEINVYNENFLTL